MKHRERKGMGKLNKCKRLQGLEKKAMELCILCDAEIMLLCFDGSDSDSYVAWPQDQYHCLSLIKRYSDHLTHNQHCTNKRKRSDFNDGSSPSTFKRMKKIDKLNGIRNGDLPYNTNLGKDFDMNGVLGNLTFEGLRRDQLDEAMRMIEERIECINEKTKMIRMLNNAQSVQRVYSEQSPMMSVNGYFGNQSLMIEDATRRYPYPYQDMEMADQEEFINGGVGINCSDMGLMGGGGEKCMCFSEQELRLNVENLTNSLEANVEKTIQVVDGSLGTTTEEDGWETFLQIPNDSSFDSGFDMGLDENDLNELFNSFESFEDGSLGVDNGNQIMEMGNVSSSYGFELHQDYSLGFSRDLGDNLLTSQPTLLQQGPTSSLLNQVLG